MNEITGGQERVAEALSSSSNNVDATRKFIPHKSSSSHQANGCFAPGNKLGGNLPVIAKAKTAKQLILGLIGGEKGFDKLVKKIYAQALKGQYRQQELLMNYILGKPVDRLKIEAGEQSKFPYSPVVRIIADHMRLEKLEKDSLAAAEKVFDESRVQEMESILNKAMSDEDKNGEVVRETESALENSSNAPARRRGRARVKKKVELKGAKAHKKKRK